jgi:hypothetical protein
MKKKFIHILEKLSNQKLKKLDNKFVIDFKGIVWNVEMY